MAERKSKQHDTEMTSKLDNVNWADEIDEREDDSIHELCEKVFDTTISEILNVRSQINQDILENAIETLVALVRLLTLCLPSCLQTFAR